MDYFFCDIYIKECEQWIHKADQNTLDAWHARLFTFISRKTAGFIWNREPLQLFVNRNGKVPCISGRMIHGDAIDDEWLAVWLLREVTIKFHELVVSVHDSDGEFLLAEAAMHIPRWITPENSMNRVFMHRGQLHIVPLAVTSTNKDASSEVIGLETALDAVIDTNIPTLAPAAAGLAAFARLEEYPEKIRQSMHRARCRLPVAVAHALAEQPMLIAAASELFYTRDPVQMKVCLRMERFPPEPSTDTLVLFNRAQYAKLVSQSIRTPAVFELPPAESPQFKARVLGMKVACGFEILAHEGNTLAAAPVYTDITNSVNGNKITGFLDKLNEFGYFDGLAVTSEAYSRRRAYAARQFAESQRCSAGARMSEELLARQASQTLAEVVTTVGNNYRLPIDGETIDNEDDDSWLALNPEELDALMRKTESVLHETSQNDQEEMLADAASGNAAQDLQSLLERFETFLAADAGIEGATMMA
ncbi:SGT1-domain-containing protein [Coemansia reversa NRRL 1564]|uniref:SGT1-domain-containing protein n=1 Tax=Coemansia reversa (strain ATCC 12441 / NRRL 1564) TaxID=763665 RepID=A0A2G5BJT6_COERN|nr:SGT1-domain-containing protein [Coemansia reversa NRRL 1564]|eukprot:PIA19242.1 SGT1-domain-containing protein [Coemansia reversa NRRL 1564]